MGRLPRRPDKEYVIKSQQVQSTTSPFRRKEDRITGEPVEEMNQGLGRIRVRIGKEKRLEQQLQR